MNVILTNSSGKRTDTFRWVASEGLWETLVAGGQGARARTMVSEPFGQVPADILISQ